MTREEAITVLNMVEAHGLAEEAKQIAIQALSQEPCTDAVSRQAAIEAVKQAIYNHDSAIMRLTELPSVSTTKNIVNHGTMNITL